MRLMRSKRFITRLYIMGQAGIRLNFSSLHELDNPEVEHSFVVNLVLVKEAVLCFSCVEHYFLVVGNLQELPHALHVTRVH